MFHLSPGKFLLNGVEQTVIKQRLVLSGSFNPLHEGHIKLMQVAKARFPDLEPLFELSLHNADKGGITVDAIQKRVAQFTQRGLDLALTNAPLFT